jgi:hypothetical protein
MHFTWNRRAVTARKGGAPILDCHIIVKPVTGKANLGIVPMVRRHVAIVTNYFNLANTALPH